MKKLHGAAAWLAALCVCCMAVLIIGAVVCRFQKNETRMILRPVDEQAVPTPPSSLWINRATKQELMELKGMGSKLADRVIEQREKEPFFFPEDLATVSGIGDKRLKQWNKDITRP